MPFALPAAIAQPKLVVSFVCDLTEMQINLSYCITTDKSLTNGDPADVSLKLHQEIILRHFPVDVKLRQMNPSIFLHSFNDVHYLIAACLECSSNQVILRGESC